MIKVNNLNKFYNAKKDNEIHVINNVNLNLPNQGFVSFLGASGSGKTTLLNVIGGLDKASGEISYDDISVVNYKMSKIDRYRREHIGYVFQNYNLLLNETVYDNLLIALQMCGIYDEQEQKARIEYVLKAVGMFKYRKKKAYALSGGQQQRVSIARALVKSAKIIIADEPTGNLDKENAITVMNILKRISKNTLVLMVTHNEELANFFSDEIFKIQDGQIIDHYQTSGDETLDNSESNTIYLKDLISSNANSDALDVTCYQSKESKNKISIRLIEKNGTYYIDADQNIKLLNDSNMKVLDSHYQKIRKVEEVEQEKFDNSFYKDIKTKRNIFKVFATNIKTSYHNMKAKNRRTKILYASFTIIGVLIAIMTINLSNYLVLDDSKFVVDHNYYALHNEDNLYLDTKTQEYLKELVDKNYISDLSKPNYIYANAKCVVNLNETYSYNANLSMISAVNLPENKISEGHAPKHGEMLISKGVANDIIATTKHAFANYKDLLNNDFILNNYDNIKFKIAGVYDNPNFLTYINDLDYLSLMELNNPIHSRHGFVKRRADKEIINNEKTYEIVKGRDFIQSDFNSDKILIANVKGYDVGHKVNIDDQTYEVIGLFKFKNYSLNYRDADVIFYDNKPIQEYDSYLRPHENKQITLIEGKLPSNSKEVIASIYQNYQIGETHKGHKIVGIYNGNADAILSATLVTRDDYFALETNSGLPIFKVNDLAKARQVTKGYCDIDSTYDIQAKAQREGQMELLSIFGVSVLVLLVISVVLIYFLMRSCMISDIYNLGVYRSLGAPRHKIYLKFIYDILVTVTLTSIIGFIVCVGLYSMMANAMNVIVGTTILKNSWLFNLLGIVLIYLLNIGFGLLPAVFLMRKTPAEILSKYDI